MSEPSRRARGTADTKVGLYVEVDPDVKAKFDEMHRAVGGSKWRLMQELLRRVELDSHGRPAWWPYEVSEPQQELPLKSA